MALKDVPQVEEVDELKFSVVPTGKFNELVRFANAIAKDMHTHFHTSLDTRYHTTYPRWEADKDGS